MVELLNNMLMETGLRVSGSKDFVHDAVFNASGLPVIPKVRSALSVGVRVTRPSP